MDTKKMCSLIIPMGSCYCCIHENECKKFKDTLQKRFLFRCPFLIEVCDEYNPVKQKGWIFSKELNDYIVEGNEKH